MHILITGGTGLIGLELAGSLVRDRHKVTVLSRDPEKVGCLPQGASLEKWDPLAAEAWKPTDERIDAIVNLAGENLSAKRWTIDRKRQICDSRLNAGKAIVRAIEKSKIKPGVIVQASAVGYYGPCGDSEISETSPAGRGFLSKTCLDWENSTVPLEKAGIRRVIIRSGVVLSKNGGALPRMALPFRFFVGGRLGEGKQWVPWIHIADEVEAIRFLIDNKAAKGPFNLVAPTPVTNADLSFLLGRVLKRPSFIPLPAFVLRLMFGETSSILLESQKVVPQRLTKLGYIFRFADAEAALQDILV